MHRRPHPVQRARSGSRLWSVRAAGVLRSRHRWSAALHPVAMRRRQRRAAGRTAGQLPRSARRPSASRRRARERWRTIRPTATRTGQFNGPPPLRVRGALQGPAGLGALRLRRSLSSTATATGAGTATCSAAAPTRRASTTTSPTGRRARDGRLERRADDRGGGARQRGRVQRLPAAHPPAGRGRRGPPRRHLHQLQPRRVGAGHDRHLRRQPADVERQRLLRRLHGPEGRRRRSSSALAQQRPATIRYAEAKEPVEPAPVLVVVPLRRRPADAEPAGGRPPTAR